MPDDATDLRPVSGHPVLDYVNTGIHAYDRPADDPDRTHAEVLDVFNRAITSLEQELRA